MLVFIYSRVSSEKQDVDLSIVAQMKGLRDYAERNGHIVVEEFTDEAESGRSANRPGFLKMIAAAKRKPRPCEAILVWKLSRFARNREDSIVYKSLLRKHGIQVISINEAVDDSPSGRLLEGMIESMDEFYSANLGEDVSRGMRESASRGFVVGSKTPYGYRRIKVKDGGKERAKLEVHPCQADAVRRIFKQFSGGSGLKGVAKSLNEEGIAAPAGKRWGNTTLHGILTNEAYLGILIWGRPKSAGDPAAIRVEHAWEPIVDADTFHRVQALLKQRAPCRTNPRRVSSPYLLSGLAQCGHCGKSLVCQEAKSGKFSYYICGTLLKQGSGSCGSHYLNSRKFEELVLNKIKERILTEKNIRDLVKLLNEERDEQMAENCGQLEAVKSELDDVQARLGRLYESLETGKLSLDDLAPRIRSLRQQQERLQATRMGLERDVADHKVDMGDERTVRAHMQDLRLLLTESPICEQKTFIRSFVKEVKVTGKEVLLTYTMPIAPDGKREEVAGVLDTIHYGGPFWIRTRDPSLIRTVL